MINSVHVPYRQISEDQKTQYAQNDCQCHEKTGYTVEEPEESPETDDGHGSPALNLLKMIQEPGYDGTYEFDADIVVRDSVRDRSEE